jgi:uncharacterized OB-fold protein/acyl dehydratase
VTALGHPETTGSDGRGLGAELRRLVGRSSEVRLADDPVNQPMIRHWVEVFGDANPCYVDEAFAGRSVLGGIVAPPMMLDVWSKKGFRVPRDTANPMVEVLARLDAAGFTSIVAVNSELELDRALRPGDLVASQVTVADVSDEKQTALGVGHFFTTTQEYSVAGEPVGRVLFRVLKFRPGTGRAPTAPPPGLPRPDPDPARRPRPGLNPDHQFFWDGARRRELRVQTCQDCGARHFPPTPRCPACGRFDLGWTAVSGRGHLYSFAVPHHPQVDGFRYPVLVGLVELEEGTRLVTNLVGCRREHLRIGMPLQVCWLDSHPALVEGADDSRGPITLPQFRPASPGRRTTTLTAAAVAVGDALPLAPVELTTSFVVAGAIATRDYEDVHHDRDLARRRGAPDIFPNIHTSVGMVQRWLSDWAGPEAVYRAVRVRLGVPVHPGDLLTFSGTVTAADGATGAVTVSFTGWCDRGDHVTGTAELELPQEASA